MKNLHGKELGFWNALVKDYNQRGDLSFLSIMFLSMTDSDEQLKNDFRFGSDGYYEPLLENSDMLLLSIDSCMVGKYKDTFWATDSEGELYPVGKKLHNLPYFLLDRCHNVTEDERIAEYHKVVFNVDYYQYREDYKNFCLSFGYVYTENFEFIDEGSEEFEEELKNLI